MPRRQSGSGFRMLTQGELALLPAMIGAVATVWAIGVAIYQFIYGYFWKRYLLLAEGMAWKHERTPAERAWMVYRLQTNHNVYSGYAIAGALTIVSLFASGLALATEDQAWVRLAYLQFAFAILWHLGLFTYEIRTSMRQISELAERIGP